MDPEFSPGEGLRRVWGIFPTPQQPRISTSRQISKMFDNFNAFFKILEVSRGHVPHAPLLYPIYMYSYIKNLHFIQWFLKKYIYIKNNNLFLIIY